MNWSLLSSLSTESPFPRCIKPSKSRHGGQANRLRTKINWPANLEHPEFVNDILLRYPVFLFRFASLLR